MRSRSADFDHGSRPPRSELGKMAWDYKLILNRASATSCRLRRSPGHGTGPSSVRQSASRNVKNATFRQLRAPERYVARESATHEGDPRAVCCRSSKMHTCVRSEGCARGALRPETPSTSGWKSKGNFAPACTSRWRKRASGSGRSCKATSTTMRYRGTSTAWGPFGSGCSGCGARNCSIVANATAPSGIAWLASLPAGSPYRAFCILGRRSASPPRIRAKSRMR